MSSSSSTTRAPTLTEFSNVDSILSSELLKLSLKDRNAIDEEIHGVSTVAPRETPELLQRSLAELERELDAIPDDQTQPSKEAFLASQKLSRTCVNTDDFRLRFLRCELFDARKAALRLLRYLNFASHLFGNRVLQRPPRLSDLSREEEKFLRVGNVQVLPFRDRGGRPIYAWVGGFGLNVGTVVSRHRLAFYLQCCLSEDLESQRKGLTKLIWMVGNPASAEDFRIPPWENFEYNKRLNESIPLRTCAIHYGLPDKPYFRMVRGGHTLSMGRASRSRTRIHVGQPIETLYELKTYGIPVEVLPQTGTGNLKTGYLKQWLKCRQKIEDAREEHEHDAIEPPRNLPIEIPRSTDACFRVGTSLTSHPGNILLQSLIEARMSEHASGSQKEKTLITKDIIHAIRMRKGRFLHWDKKSCGWTVMTDEVKLHTKVAAAVKGFRIGVKNVTPTTHTHSSTRAFANQDHRRDSKRRKLHEDGFHSDSSNEYSFCDTSEKSGCCLGFPM